MKLLTLIYAFRAGGARLFSGGDGETRITEGRAPCRKLNNYVVNNSAEDEPSTAPGAPPLFCILKCWALISYGFKGCLSETLGPDINILVHSRRFSNSKLECTQYVTVSFARAAAPVG
ncbi:hypothetical protein EVAR_17478_1 [Eumeta japonica]|uniref:Uncharacterized protein n=1 Tax=Eumeta variegata TaxID=151549 RepID=A0A4C1ZJK0_EUMVA|nr:hypothetical protein EVAR_17478_1 [Eumeta japonica]